MPTRYIFQPFLYKQAFMIAACLMIVQKFSKPQYRVLFSLTRKDSAPHRFTFTRVFHPLSFCFCYRTIGQTALKRRLLKSLIKIACLYSFNQKKWPSTDRGGGKTSGLVGKEPLPLSLSHARKVWSAGVGICQALAVRRGCDVSHFRMDRTMCGTPPSFFLFFLSCQMNACSLGYRTEEVIHQK